MIEMKSKFLIPLSIAALTLAVGCSSVQGKQNLADEAALSELKAGFDNPPEQARPMVWWHWMDGNITKEGILHDLEWMHRIGLRGFHVFDASLQTPQVVQKRLIYMDDGWKDAFAYAAYVADSLGLEMTVASAPGWSSTGGPWVEPEDGMKKLVWRVTEIEGGGNVDIKLPEPFRNTGGFQNGAPVGRSMVNVGKLPEYYEDVAVLAVKVPNSQKSMKELGAEVTSSGGNFSLDELSDGDVMNGQVLPKSGGEGYSWIKISFPEPVTVRSVSFAFSGSAVLEAGDDDGFRKIADLRGGRVAETTVDIPATTSKVFRLRIPDARPASPMFGMSMADVPGNHSSPGTKVSEFCLYAYTRINMSEVKAGYTSAAHAMEMPTSCDEGEKFPEADDVMDITDCMDSTGRLEWNSPEGRWRIYRFGFSLTGKMNHPAPLEATGLEVDKLDPEAWTRYFRTYLDMYKDASNGLIGQKGVQYILNDSYEAEHETWTPAMFEEFKSRRGYDLHKWLPAIAGEVIGSPEESDRFLFDWRQTLGELLADNHDLLTRLLQDEYGMKGRYTESHEAGRAFVGDGMDLKRTAQVPMSAMWVYAPWLPKTRDGDVDRSIYMADDRESASVAHIYGQNVAACESFTVYGGTGRSYAYCPENLKPVADLEFSNGINRIIVHESAHQPVDNLKPGLSLGGIGQWFNRNETWAEMAGTWVDYLSRTSFMLQAGKNVADILYYYGEDSNVTSEFSGGVNVPEGYQWDYVSPGALKSEIFVKDGVLSSKSGTQYKVLWADRNFDYVSVPVLRKISELVRGGALLAGAEPKHPASLSDDEEEWTSLVKDIWHSGRKNVCVCSTLDSLLAERKITPDFTPVSGVRFLHRSVGDNIQIYWVNRPALERADTVLSFRVKGLKPQIWHTDTGVIEDVSYRENGDRTDVCVKFMPDDAFCIVFAGKVPNASDFAETSYEPVMTISTPWRVKFENELGEAPPETVFETLKGYQEFDDPMIRYFSGTATYSNEFTLENVPGEMVLDLGHVANMAEVRVNGKYCGRAWKEPYGVNITDAVRPGKNSLEIKVANLWVNRLIGDAQPGAKKLTFTDAPTVTASDPLIPAGLLGPVRVMEVQKKQTKNNQP